MNKLSFLRVVGCAIVLQLAVLVVAVFPARASDCEPQPDYWFGEIFTVKAERMPDGVSVTPSPGDAVRGYIRIENTTSELLYVLPGEALREVIVTEEPPISDGGKVEEDYIPEEHLLLEKVPELAAFAVTAGTPRQLGISELTVLMPGFVDHNVLDMTRPNFLNLPNGQFTTFYLVYAGELYPVTVTIRYRINPAFNPVLCPQEKAPGVAPGTVSGIAVLVISVLSAGVTYAAFRVRSKRSSRKS